MARLYSDEDFPRPASEVLRGLGHDVLTCQESGLSGKRNPDESILAYAISAHRAVLTKNRGDFRRLHRKDSNHFGIVVCTNNPDFEELAHCVNAKISAQSSLAGQLIRVYRPG